MGETGLGGKPVLSNYRMAAVNSHVSKAKLGKFCPGSQTERSCLPFCAPPRPSAHVHPCTRAPVPSRTEASALSAATTDPAAALSEQAFAGTCTWFVEGQNPAQGLLVAARPELGLFGFAL